MNISRFSLNTPAASVRRNHYHVGFTLIEAIVYIALFSLIMGGILAVIYQIFQGNDSLSNNTTIQEEGNFVLRKIDWVLTSISSVSSPSGGIPYGRILSITHYDSTQIVVRLNSGKIEVSENGGSTYLPITTDNVSTTNLQFHYITASGTGLDGIEASTTINGIVFYTKKYLRK